MAGVMGDPTDCSDATACLGHGQGDAVRLDVGLRRQQGVLAQGCASALSKRTMKSAIAAAFCGLARALLLAVR